MSEQTAMWEGSDQRLLEGSQMTEDWYEERHSLREGQVFRMRDGSTVKLDERVPGDGTDWYVLSYYGGGWHDDRCRIHPSDLKEFLPTK